jgi:DNA segregation ATPase FtsK/SpoIIIE, S-DNA-T family
MTLTHIKRWVLAASCYMAALGLLVSLSSYTATDYSSIYDTTEAGAYGNWLGQWGANIAGLLLYFFGCSSVFISLFFLILGVSYSMPYSSLADRGRRGAIAVLLFVSTLLARRYSFELFAGVYPGGLVGGTLLGMFERLLDRAVLDLFLWILMWSLGILLFRFSWVEWLTPYFSFIRVPLLHEFFQKVWVLVKSKMAFSFLHPAAESNESTIYADPFWHEFIKPAQQTEEPLPQEESHNNMVLEEPAYQLPKYEKSSSKESSVDKALQAENEQRARMLEHKLERFGIQGKVTAITQGPVVTLFEYQPAIDAKISTILAREDDLALALQAVSLRIIAPIPGRSVIGFEVAHNNRKAVLFRELVSSDQFVRYKGALPLILGKDTLGATAIIDLASMPHLLVAGSTGSGKSVGLNCMLMSLLCSRTPQEVKCILIDPKRLEFSVYADIAHLLFPIVTDPREAGMVLRWAVKTMEERYTQMAQKGVRNIHEYNTRAEKLQEEQLPFIVIIIDELADLMMTAGKDVEQLIARLAQMARAAGMHLILATQRPSVDVITGLIKVNFPSRIAFKVTSKVDSRTILDSTGAEKLLGKGDMLFLDGKGMVSRIHGAYVTDEEIATVVQHIKAQQPPCYTPLFVPQNETSVEDELYPQIISFIEHKDEVSISLIQRVFSIGYNRSARIIDLLEKQGYIMAADGSKMRKVAKEVTKNHHLSNKI